MPSQEYAHEVVQAFINKLDVSVAAPIRQLAKPRGVEGIPIAYDGNGNLWSYRTCIATRTNSGEVIINMQHYSKTTTMLQRRLLRAVEEVEQQFAVVFRGFQGMTPSKLVAEAHGNYIPDYENELSDNHLLTGDDVLRMERLKRQARLAAKHHHHKLSNFRRITKYLQRAECNECGMEVDVNTNPRPNETDIAGPAIAQVCNHNDNKD